MLLLSVLLVCIIRAETVTHATLKTVRKTLSKDTVLCYYAHDLVSSTISRCYLNIPKNENLFLSSVSSFSCSSFEYPRPYCPQGTSISDSQSYAEVVNTVPVVIPNTVGSDVSRSFFNCVTYTYCNPTTISHNINLNPNNNSDSTVNLLSNANPNSIINPPYPNPNANLRGPINYVLNNERHNSKHKSRDN